jgi:hypothetical protein
MAAKGTCVGGTLTGNAPAERSRIKRNDPRFFASAAGVGHFGKVAIALDQELASLLPGLGHAVGLGVRGIETYAGENAPPSSNQWSIDFKAMVAACTATAMTMPVNMSPSRAMSIERSLDPLLAGRISP